MSTFSRKKERKMIQWSKDTIENMKQEKKSFMPSGKGTMTVIFYKDSLTEVFKTSKLILSFKIRYN